jgi:hypothetical protein
MAITQAVCGSFKQQILQGAHNFSVLTGTNTVSSVAAAGGTQGPNATACTVYTGTFTNAANDAYAGLTITMSGGSTAANNGTYLCVASSATTLTLTNPNGVTQSAGTEPLVFLSGQNIFAIALYPSTATLSESTTAYTSTNEVASSGTYVAGGIGPGGTLVGNAMALVSTTPVQNGSAPIAACCSFASISWTAATITARGALIYNASLGTAKTNMPACVVLNFTTDQTSTAGTFTINFPAQTKGNAIISIQ